MFTLVKLYLQICENMAGFEGIDDDIYNDDDSFTLKTIEYNLIEVLKDWHIDLLKEMNVYNDILKALNIIDEIKESKHIADEIKSGNIKTHELLTPLNVINNKNDLSIKQLHAIIQILIKEFYNTIELLGIYDLKYIERDLKNIINDSFNYNKLEALFINKIPPIVAAIEKAYNLKGVNNESLGPEFYDFKDKNNNYVLFIELNNNIYGALVNESKIDLYSYNFNNYNLWHDDIESHLFIDNIIEAEKDLIYNIEGMEKDE